ncbi:MAG: NAD(P)-dependent oxidoreductase [Nocardioidaceae bacterium]|nr:NAD(P)-dependent oxidoreductase [Nocardioidaceae bacterium]
MSLFSDERPTIGWIGAGRMGLQLAIRLIDAGYDVAIYNRTRSKTQPAVDRGAVAVDSPAELAGRDIVFSMVSASQDLLQVMTGDEGVLSNPQLAPKVVVDCSTVSVAASAEVRAAAEKGGTAMLAAPVSGNPKVVAVGEMTMAVSGEREVFDEVEPVLLPLGKGVTYVGEGEVARLVKICHNVFLGVVIQSLSEITLLAQKGGASRAAFLEFLNDSVMGSVFSRYKSPALVNLDFTPTFTMPLLLKDFTLGLEAGHELGVPMPVASAAENLVASAIGAGHVADDFATLVLEQARRSGMELVPEDVVVDDGLSGR